MPEDVMHGTFNLKYVILSYLIASFTSYVALDMSSHLKLPNTLLFRICWWCGGAVVMGAGIWSMHFIGMLAFDMDMPMAMTYSLWWTGLSIFIATITAGLAFLFFMIKNPRPINYILSGVTLGIAISTMHYIGMAGMNNVIIHYRPGLFCLSILVAIIAATVAVWLASHGDRGTYQKRVQKRVISALIMGFAIAGMHYTGMFAAVITPAETMVNGIDAAPSIMAVLITISVLCIMTVALILSTTRYYVSATLQNEKDFLEVVLNSLNGGVMAFDTNKKIRLYNKAAKDLFINIDSLKKLLKEQKSNVYDNEVHPLDLVFSGEKISAMEAVVRNKDGDDRVISIDGQLLTDYYGEQLGAVVVYQDITEHKHIDQMRNEFITTVSHELKSSISSIRGSLRLIIGGSIGNIPSEIRTVLEMTANNSDRLVHLVDNILDTEKIEAGKMSYNFESHDLCKLVEEAVVENKAYADEYQITYILKKQNSSVMVFADKLRIRQVVDNLLSNAAKYSKPGSTVEINIKSNNEFVRVEVVDAGVGVVSDMQPQIFSKFYKLQADAIHEKYGAGLGLSICKSIIEAHRGKIGLKSIPNVGSTFYFELLEDKGQENKV